MAFEALPSTGPGSAEAGRVVRASWGEQVRLNFDDHEERIQDLEAASALTWRGAWDADTAYSGGDLVSHNGSVWRATGAIPVASPADEPGVSSPTEWEVFLGAPDLALDDLNDVTIGSPLSDGDVLTYDATSSPPGWVNAPPVSGLVLLEEHTASASASLDFESWYSADYDEYQIEFIGIVPATDNTDLRMRMSTNGGSTYDSGSNYSYAYTNATNAFVAGVGSTSAAFIIVTQGIDITVTQNSVGGSMKLIHPGSSALYKMVTMHTATFKNDANFYTQSGTGQYKSATAVNAFRFLMSSGNIASGTIRVYGISKS